MDVAPGVGQKNYFCLVLNGPLPLCPVCSPVVFQGCCVGRLLYEFIEAAYGIAIFTSSAFLILVHLPEFVVKT
jgi:hypothetical protein